MRRSLMILAIICMMLVGFSPAQAQSGSDPQARATGKAFVTPALLQQLEEKAKTSDPFVNVIITFDAGASMQTAAPQTSAIETTRVSILGAMPAGSYEVVSTYSRIASMALKIDTAGLNALLQHPAVRAINEDAEFFPLLTQANALTGANTVHSLGFTGEGVTVAVIDSGVDSNNGVVHPALADDLLGEYCFRTDCINGVTSAEDQTGHGTHVAGVITGPNGVAPDAKFYALKVFSTGGTHSGIVLGALNYVIDLNIANPGTVDIVNMSIGGADYSDQASCDAANTATRNAFTTLNAQGVSIFVSTGNDANINGVGAPGCISGAIGVGSVTDSVVSFGFGSCSEQGQPDKVSCYSNTTPVQGAGELVDLLAPGCDIASTHLNETVNVNKCGTSMAAPYAAGVGALLIEYLNDNSLSMTPAQLEAHLEATGVMINDYRLTNGPLYPRVSPPNALGALEVTPVASLNVTGSTSTTVSLEWSASAEATQYKLYRSVNNAAATLVNTITAPTLTYTDTSVPCGVLQYTIAPTDGTYTAPTSSPAVTTARVCPITPVNLTLTEVDQDTLQLNWTDNNPSEISNILQRQVNNGTFVDYQTLSPGTNFQYTDDALACATYGYRVIANVGGDLSAPSNTVTKRLCVPSNDLYENAKPITTTTLVDTIPNAQMATKSANDPTYSCKYGGAGGGNHSVWWTYTPASNGTVSINTLASTGSFDDTLLAIYTGTLGSFSEVACNDDQSGANYRSILTNVPVTGGTTYTIYISRWNPSATTAVGSLVMNFAFTASADVIVTQTGGATELVEGGATDTYSVALASAPSANVTITVNHDGQVTATPTSLVFNNTNWNTPQIVTVEAVDDVISEGVHTSTLTHTSASADSAYNGRTIASVTASITDNDAVGVTVSQTGSSTDVTEGGATDTYTIVLNNQPVGDVSITVSSDAQITADPSVLTFTIANWDTPQTVTITAVNDDVAEGTHSSTVTHVATGGGYDGVSIADVLVNITDNDTQGVTITQSDGTTAVTEGGATDTYTVVLNTQPTADVTVSVTSSAQATVNPTALTFTTANWNVAQTVTVTALDDNIAESAHTATITHSATGGGYTGVSIASVTVNITDNDTAGVTIAQSGGNTTATEGGAGDSYTVVLTSQPTANVIVTVTGNAQVTLSPTTLTFTTANWNTAQTVNVSAVNDVVAEGAHTATVSHSASGGGYTGVVIGSVTVSITDNDTAGFTLVQSGGSTSLVEGATGDSYTLVLTSQPTAPVTISINGTAQATVNPSSLTFTTATWNVAQTVIVTAVDDVIAEGNHSTTITHSVSSPDPMYNGLGVTNVTANIIDNDNAGVTITPSGGTTVVVEGGATDTYTVVLTSQPTANVVVSLVSDAQTTVSPTSLTFTSGNWNSPQTITVTAVDDTSAEGVHTSVILHGVSSSDSAYSGLSVPSVVVDVSDNDAPGVVFTDPLLDVSEAGLTDSFTLRLASQPTAPVSVEMFIIGDEVTLNPALLTFTPVNWATPQTVVVTTTDDRSVEGTHYDDILFLYLSDDPNFNLPPNSPDFPTALSHVLGGSVIEIVDNDSATYHFTTASGSVAELGGTAQVSVGLTFNTSGTGVSSLESPITIPFSVNGASTATGGEVDYGLASLTVTIPVDGAAQLITVNIMDDAIDEPNETVILNLGTEVGGTVGQLAAVTVGTPSEYTLTILDDDAGTPAGITLTDELVTVTEGGANDTFSLALNKQPSADVTIDIAAAGDDVTVSPLSLTFTIANWNTPQVVTVSAVNDRIVEGAHTDDLTFAYTSADAEYNAPAPSEDFPATLSTARNSDLISITDNDAATYAFVTASSSVPEGVGTATVHVALTLTTNGTGVAELAAPITVSFTSADGTATSSDYTVTGSTLTFAGTNEESESISISIVPDTIVELDEVFTLSLGSSTSPLNPMLGVISIGTPSTHAVTIINDDAPGVVITNPVIDVVEGGATDSFTLRLATQPSANVVIDLWGYTQTTPSPETLTFTPANWDTPQTVTVTATDDRTVEGTHYDNIFFLYTSADAEYDFPAPSAAFPQGLFDAPGGDVAEILDNDSVTYQFTSTDTTITESVASVNLSVGVTLTTSGTGTEQLGHTFTIPFTVDGTATGGGVDYTITGSSVDMPLSGATQTIAISIVNDLDQESHETIVVTLDDATSPFPYQLTGTSKGTPDVHTVNLIDNDAPGVIFTNPLIDVSEAGTTDSFTIALASEPTDDVTVDMFVIGGNVTLSTTLLTFTVANWDLPQTVVVTAVNDQIVEGVHYDNILFTYDSDDLDYNLPSDSPEFPATLSSVPNGGNVIEITDNDTATYHFNLAGQTVDESVGLVTVTVDVTFNTDGTGAQELESNITIPFTVNVASTATGGGVDYTLVDSEVEIDFTGTSAAFDITIVNDSTVESAETIALDLGTETGGLAGQLAAVTAGTPATTIITITDNDGIFYVTNTNDSGAGSLRQAISDANTAPGANLVYFNIPGPGPHTITALSEMLVVGQITIDGTTQPGASCNAWPPTLQIELVRVGGAGGIINVSAHDSTIRGLAFKTFNNGLVINTNNIAVKCNYFGLDAAGTAEFGGSNGILVNGSSGGRIGGPLVTDRNVFSSNTSGIRWQAATTGYIVENNYFGTDAAGLVDFGNTSFALDSRAGSNGTQILNNLFAGNDNTAIQIVDQTTTGNIVRGNTFGLSANGSAMPNGVAISVHNTNTHTIGGLNPGDANIITNSNGRGISIGTTGTTHSITVRGNSIYGNTGLGIDLGADASVHLNDLGDGDTGSNGLQNFPVLNSAAPGATTITGTLNSTASATFTIDVYANEVCDANGHGEGKTYLGSTSVTMDGSGNGSFSLSVSPLTNGTILTATATSATGSTSEFSACAVVANFGATVTESGGSTNLTEGGATDTYTIALTAQPLSNVTVTVTGDANVSVSPTTLTFTTANWNTTQTVTLTAVNDTLFEGAHTGTVTHSASGGGYSGVSIASVTANITDNDGGAVSRTPATVSVTEGGATSSYTISLNAVSGVTATTVVTADADCRISTDSASGPWFASLTATLVNTTPTTVYVRAYDDKIVEGTTHSCVITHGNTSSATPNFQNLSIANVTGTITDNDTATYRFTSAASSVSELTLSFTAPADLNFNVTGEDAGESGSLEAAIVVPFVITGGTASGGGLDCNCTTENMHIAVDGTITNTPKLLGLIDDVVVEDSETFHLGFDLETGGTTAQRAAVTLGSPSAFTLTILDNDVAGVQVTGSPLTLSEGGAFVTYTLMMNAPNGVTAQTSVTGDADCEISIDGGSTYATSTQSITLTNSNTLTVRVRAVDDGFVEGTPHTCIITHANTTSATPAYNNLVVSSVVGNITDDDIAGVVITTPVIDVTEGGTTDSFTIALTSQPTADVTIDLWGYNQTTPSVATLTFTSANWNVAQTVTVTADDDLVVEGTHYDNLFFLYTSADAAYNLPATSAQFPAGLSDAPGGDVIEITDNDTAGVTITDPSLALAEGGVTDSFSIALVSQPTSNVVITLSPESQVSISPLSLTFTAANWNTPQAVTVTAVNDRTVEGAHTSDIGLSYTSAHTPYDSPSASSAFPASLSTAPGGAAIDIADNDSVTYQFTASANSVSESAGTVNVTINTTFTTNGTGTNALAAPVTVPFTVGGSATSPADYTLSATSVILPTAGTAQTVSVSLTDDASAEPNETITLTLGAETGGSAAQQAVVTIGTPNVRTITITDNDSAGVVITNPVVDVTEGGTTDSFTIALTSQPTADVTVELWAYEKVTPSTTILTFTSANWDTPQTVTVTADNDRTVEGTHYDHIFFLYQSADANYDFPPTSAAFPSGLFDAPGGDVIEITDNDSATYQFIASSGSFSENVGAVSLSISVTFNTNGTGDNALAAAITIPFTLGGTATNGADYTVSGSNVVIPANGESQTISITVIGDNILELDETFLVTLGNETGGTVNQQTVVTKGSPAVYTGTILNDDAAGVVITTPVIDVTEGGATDSFTVALTSQPTANVVVTLLPDSQVSLSSTTLTFTAGNWNTPQVVTVTANNDRTVEGVHYNDLAFLYESADPNYNLPEPSVAFPFLLSTAPGGAVIQITDNDSATYQFTAAANSVSESAGATNVTVSLTFNTDGTGGNALSAPVSVPFTLGGTASSGTDFTIGASSVTIPTGGTSQTIAVTLVDDSVVEINETVTLTLGTETGGSVGQQAVITVGTPNVRTITITDNDVVGVLITDPVIDVTEGGATDSFTVALTSQPTADVSVELWGYTQVTPSAATLTFTPANWNTPQTVTVTADNDRTVEGTHYDHIFFLYTSADANYDFPPTSAAFPAGLFDAPSGDVIEITDNDSATYQFAASSGSFAENVGSVNLSVGLTFNTNGTGDNALAAAITIPFTLSGTATNGSDYTVVGSNVVIPANGDTQTISITVISDNIVELDETFLVTLGNETGGTVNQQTVVTKGSPSVYTATILNDDSVGVIITNPVIDVVEGGATDSFTVALSSQPTANVTVELWGYSHVTPSATSLTFTSANWNTPQTVTVTADDDRTVEGVHYDHIFFLYTSADATYNFPPTSAAFPSGLFDAPGGDVIEIVDNDSATYQFTTASSSTNEGAGAISAVVSVTFNTSGTGGNALSAPITIPFTVGGTATGGGVDYTVSGATVTIPAGGTSQNIVVTILDDALVEASETVSLTLGTETGGTAAQRAVVTNGTPATHTLTITDNDVIGVIFTNPVVDVVEGGVTDSFTVVLRSQPTANVTIELWGYEHVTPNATTLTFTPVNWNVPQTVTVTANDDRVVEGIHYDNILFFYTSADANYNAPPVSADFPAGLFDAPGGDVIEILDNDAASYQFTAAASTIAESVGALTVTVNMTFNTTGTGDNTLSAPITVPFTVGGTATGGGVDYSVSAASVTIPTNGTSQSFSVTVLDDSLLEVDETITISLGNETGGTASQQTVVTKGSPSVRTITITDNDSVGVVITNPVIDVVEGGASDSFTIALKSQPSANVTIDLWGYTQVTPSAATLTFTPANWNTPQIVTVTADDDRIVEGVHYDNILLLYSSADANYNFPPVSDDFPSGLFNAPGGDVAEIVDNDSATYQFTTATNSVDESVGTTSATVSLTFNTSGTGDNALESAITIPFTVNGTATGGSVDYSLSGSSVTIPTNGASQTITITVVNDTSTESDETVMLTLGAETGGTVSQRAIVIHGEIVIHTLTIVDDDTLGVVISNPVIDVAEGGVTDSFTVALASQPSANVTIDLWGYAQVSPSASSLIFTPVNWNIPQTVTVTADDDRTVEGAHSDNILFLYTSADANYNLPPTSAAFPSGLFDAPGGDVIEITDNDSATYQFVTESATVSEAVSTVQTEVSLTFNTVGTGDNALSAAITVPFTIGGTATGGGVDYTVSGSSVTIPANGATQTITITVVNDALIEPSETVVMTLGVETGGTAAQQSVVSTGSPSTHTLNITDDDLGAVTLTQSGGSTLVTEGGAGDSYTVVLAAQPTSNVTLNVSGDAQVSVSPTTLTFTTGNWNVAQTVTVTAVNDTLVEGTHTGVITHSVSGGGYNGVSVDAVTVIITDNDLATVKPVVPTLLTPTNNQNVTGTKSPTLVWQANPAADQVTSYRMTLKNNATGAIILNKLYAADSVCAAGVCSLNLGTQSPVVALANATYNWQVTAINPIGSTKSILFRFSIVKPSKPTLVSPVGVTLNNPTPTLVFNIVEGENLDSLKVTVSGGTNFTQTFTNINAICSGTTCSVPVTTALKNGKYTWVVQAKNVNGNINSVSGTFTIAFPDKATNLAPTGNAVVNTQKPTLSWSQVANANEYRVVVTHSSGTVVTLDWAASGAAGLTCDGTTCFLDMTTFTGAPNLKKGSHKWYVQARNTAVIAASTSKSANAAFKIVLPTRTERGETEGEALPLPPSGFRAP